MGKMKWSVSGSEVDETEDSGEFTPYEGPDLKPGVYPVVMETLATKEFSSGNEGFEMRLRVKAPKGHPKAAYDGAPIWDRFPVIDSMMWKSKQFLVALGGSGKDLDNTVQDNDRKVTRLGRIGNPIGKEFRVSLRSESYTNDDNERLTSIKVARFMPAGDADEAPAPEETTRLKEKRKGGNAKAAPEPETTPEPETKGKKSKKKGQAEEPPF